MRLKLKLFTEPEKLQGIIPGWYVRHVSLTCKNKLDFTAGDISLTDISSRIGPAVREFVFSFHKEGSKPV